jgi:hypothetical protein
VDVGYRTLLFDLSANPISIIGLVAHRNGTAIKVDQKLSGTMTVVHLAAGKHQLDRPVNGIDDGMYLCHQSSSTAPCNDECKTLVGVFMSHDLKAHAFLPRWCV